MNDWPVSGPLAPAPGERARERGRTVARLGSSNRCFHGVAGAGAAAAKPRSLTLITGASLPLVGPAPATRCHDSQDEGALKRSPPLPCPSPPGRGRGDFCAGGWGQHAVLLICLLLLFPPTLPAQTSRLSFDPAPTMPAMVSDRPTMTEWVASVYGTGLVEGRLQLIVTGFGQYLGSVLTDELVFSGADQKVRIVLPPMTWNDSVDEILVDLRLHTKQGIVPLPQQRLRTSLRRAQKFPLLLAQTNLTRRKASRRDELVDRLRFESLLPEEVKDHAITVISYLRAEELPQDSLSYCQFEVVVIPGEAFPLLRPAQCEALEKWARAGGSLFLEPAGQLEPSHVDFLNRLAAEDPRKLVFSLDTGRRLPLDLYFGERIGLHFQAGLGTVILHRDQADFDQHPEEWRASVDRLWKLRPFYQGAASEARLAQAVASGALRNFDYQDGMAALNAPFVELMDLLKPPEMQLVPLWVITLVMASLVLMIGPADYFLLGWLKRRKWTWITFPCTIVAMTGLTMLITNAYLSTSESRRAMVIHDVGPDGKIVRTNRFELIFASATRQVVSDVQGALFQPLLTGGVVDPYNFNPRQSLGATSEAGSVEGRVPMRYKVHQDVRQWRPQLNRKFSIGPPADAKPIDWDALGIPATLTQSTLIGAEAQNLLPKVRAVFGPRANLLVLPIVGGTWTSEPAPAYSPQRFHRPDYRALQQQQLQLQWQQMQQQGIPISAQHRHLPQTNILERLSATYPRGAAPVVSSNSPRGGRTLDDLPVTVLGDYDRWWLVIMVPDGDNVVVYRKPYDYAAGARDDAALQRALDQTFPQLERQPPTPSLRVKQLAAPGGRTP